MGLPRGPPGSGPRGASGSGLERRERNITMSRTNENSEVISVPDNSHDDGPVVKSQRTKGRSDASMFKLQRSVPLTTAMVILFRFLRDIS